MVNPAVGTLPKEIFQITMCSFAHEHSKEVIGVALRISNVFVLLTGPATTLWDRHCCVHWADEGTVQYLKSPGPTPGLPCYTVSIYFSKGNLPRFQDMTQSTYHPPESERMSESMRHARRSERLPKYKIYVLRDTHQQMSPVPCSLTSRNCHEHWPGRGEEGDISGERVLRMSNLDWLQGEHSCNTQRVNPSHWFGVEQVGT